MKMIVEHSAEMKEIMEDMNQTNQRVNESNKRMDSMNQSLKIKLSKWHA